MVSEVRKISNIYKNICKFIHLHIFLEAAINEMIVANQIRCRARVTTMLIHRDKSSMVSQVPRRLMHYLLTNFT